MNIPKVMDIMFIILFIFFFVLITILGFVSDWRYVLIQQLEKAKGTFSSKRLWE